MKNDVEKIDSDKTIFVNNHGGYFIVSSEPNYSTILRYNETSESKFYIDNSERNEYLYRVLEDVIHV